MVHFGVFAFFLSIFFIPFSVVTFEICDIVHQVYTNKKFYNTISQLDNFRNYTDICLYGDGNIIDQFNLAGSPIQQIQNLSKNIMKVNDYMADANKYNLSSMFTTLYNWSNYTSNLAYGLTVDSAQTTDDNNMVAIASLNKYTDYQASGTQQTPCKEFLDQWVYNLTNCTKTKWSAGSPATYKVGSDVCIDISSFDSSNFSSRYPATSCVTNPQMVTKTLSYLSSIKNYDIERRYLFNNITNDLFNLTNKNDVLTGKILNLNATIFSYLQIVLALAKNLSDPNSGIFTGINCSFISTEFGRLHDSICVCFLTYVYGLGVCLCIIGFGMCFGAIFANRLGMKFFYANKFGLKEDTQGNLPSEPQYPNFVPSYNFGMYNKVYQNPQYVVQNPQNIMSIQENENNRLPPDQNNFVKGANQ